MVNGEKIRQIRKSLGMSQEALANQIGVSKVTICWYENNERTPTLDNFLKLADILNITLDELTGREINVVAQGEDYSVKLPKQDIAIISELKNHKELYKKLYNDPVRTLELIDRRMK